MVRSIPKTYLGAANIFLIAVSAFIYTQVTADRLLSIHIYESGKGKAVLVQSPEGRTVLIDAGTDAGLLRDLGETLPPWQRSIDLLIPLTERSIGAEEVRKRYRVDAVAEALARGTRLALDARTSLDVRWPAHREMPDPPIMLLTYGATAIEIALVATPRIERYLNELDSDSAAADFRITSSTEPMMLTSDGTVLAIPAS